MIKSIKKIISSPFTILRILLIIAIIGFISSRFIEYSDLTNKIFSIALYSIIGIVFLLFSWASDRKILKWTFLICGIYLIVMNFFIKSDLVSIIGIICTITPFVIVRIFPDYEDEETIDLESV